jgi:hypothetical protein
MSAPDSSNDLDDTYRELVRDRILYELDQISTDQMLMVYGRLLNARLND